MFKSVDFLQAIENKEVYYFNNCAKAFPSIKDFDPIELEKLLSKKRVSRGDPFSDNLFIEEDDRDGRIVIEELEVKPFAPDISKQIVNELSIVFKDKKITSHLYSAPVQTNTKRIHKDHMDVIFLQVYGKVKCSIWKNPNEMIEERILNQGDMVYLPTGVYHWFKPISSRISLSFGLE